MYEKLLIHDHMDHRTLFQHLRAAIQQRFDRPVSILDLGCGDLTPLLPILNEVPVSRYVGIDESDGALQIAHTRLARLDVSSRLVKGDLLEALANMDEKFDVVLASFSLHHLARPELKLKTLEAVNQLLGESGIFVLIDVFCQEQELRQDYVDRWIEHADQRYESLLPEEKALLFDHVRARDFPISRRHWQSLGEQAGFPGFHMLWMDHAELNGVAVLSA